MTNTLCLQKEIPEERHPKVFRTINILVTILLISSYVEILFAYHSTRFAFTQYTKATIESGKVLTAFRPFLTATKPMSYSQAAPTIINKMNRTTINANPPLIIDIQTRFSTYNL